MPQYINWNCPDLPTLFNDLVPTYNSKVYRPMVARVLKWDTRYSKAIKAISPTRFQGRWTSYIDPIELKRVRKKLDAKDAATMRFGVAKTGYGFHGERGDFCIVGASIDGKHLTICYRVVELVGGLPFDLVLIDELGKQLGRPWKRVSFLCADARTIAYKNGNQNLFPKLQAIFRDE